MLTSCETCGRSACSSSKPTDRTHLLRKPTYCLIILINLLQDAKPYLWLETSSNPAYHSCGSGHAADATFSNPPKASFTFVRSTYNSSGRARRGSNYERLPQGSVDKSPAARAVDNKAVGVDASQGHGLILRRISEMKTISALQDATNPIAPDSQNPRNKEATKSRAYTDNSLWPVS